MTTTNTKVVEMGTVRVEADGTSDLYRVYLWLNRHRGQTVELGDGRKLTLGVPISGARSAIVAAVTDDGIGGVFRAIATADESRPVRLMFDVRASGGRDAADVQELGAGVLRALSSHIADSELFDRVA